jgi:hydroxyacylglutathione hydrolase
MSGLEDHAGDIVRKSRMGLGIAIKTVLEDAGIDQATLEQFESEGTIQQEPQWKPLCQRLHLEIDKFLSIHIGWTPQSQPPERIPQVRQIMTDDGGMEVNAYIVWDTETREAALFDTGWNSIPIEQYVQENDLKLKHLFITHQHHDHVAAMTPLRKAYPDIQLWAQGKGVPRQNQVSEGQQFSMGSLNIEARLTPGHAADGVTYVINGLSGDYPRAAIVGDAIFAGSMGGASQYFELAKTNIREAILSLPNPTLICPGHGPLTTLEEELAHNPFF